MCPIFHSDDTDSPLANFSDHVMSLVVTSSSHLTFHLSCCWKTSRHPSIMPKGQPKSNGVKRKKTSDTLTERPNRATKRPHRYRQDERTHASDNESHIISDSDSRRTLEARIRALKSVIANRANTTTNTKQPEPTPQDPLQSISQTAQHSR